MRDKPAPKFATEAAMCAAFMDWARPQGWTPYPETADYDIVLVHADGTQIGIHAKLKFNIKVLCQLSEYITAFDHPGPDFRALLVPAGAVDVLCSALGFVAFEADRWDGRFTPSIEAWQSYPWHFWNPSRRCELPRFIPDTTAGEPSPTQLTKWKIEALGIAATLELQGFVTRADFQHHGIDYRRWAQDWLEAMAGSPGRWVRGSRCPDFAAQHPVVYQKVRDETAARLAQSRTLL